MQLIKKNIILALLGITVLLIFAAGFYFGSSQGSYIQNIRKLFDSSISEFEEQSTQQSEESLIQKPSPTQSPAVNSSINDYTVPISSPNANPTTTRPTFTPRQTLTPTPTTYQRTLKISTPTPAIIR